LEKPRLQPLQYTKKVFYQCTMPTAVSGLPSALTFEFDAMILAEARPLLVSQKWGLVRWALIVAAVVLLGYACAHFSLTPGWSLFLFLLAVPLLWFFMSLSVVVSVGHAKNANLISKQAQGTESTVRCHCSPRWLEVHAPGRHQRFPWSDVQSMHVRDDTLICVIMNEQTALTLGVPVKNLGQDLSVGAVLQATKTWMQRNG
jgi:hypothetical protein